MRRAGILNELTYLQDDKTETLSRNLSETIALFLIQMIPRIYDHAPTQPTMTGN